MIALLRPVLGILTFGLTIPVWAILAVFLWVQFDKSSAIRTAVNRAVTELVAGAELEAERAKGQALSKINAELAGKAAALETANRRFSDSLKEAQSDLETANEQLADILAQPVNLKCAVDASLLDRLRNQ